MLCLSALAAASQASAVAKDPGPEAGKDAAPAAAPQHAVGRLVRVPLPITGRVDEEVKRSISRALGRLHAEHPEDRPPPLMLILEFSHGQSESGGGSDFESALSLARFLTGREMAAANVKTVAYLPRSVTGHAVLVAMACDEIVMAPDAEIGAAGIDENPGQDPNFQVDEAVLAGYKQIALARRTIDPAIARGMLDPQQEVLRVETQNGAKFVLRKDLGELRAKEAIQGEPEVVIPRGKLGKFSGREARDLGLARYLAPDRMSVARALGLPAEAMQEDPLVDGELHGVRVTLDGPIDTRMMETRRRMIELSRRDPKVNLICLWIDSAGGDVEAATQLAKYVADLPRDQVLTVAYIPHECRGVASLVAVACDQIVMNRGAQIGGGDNLPTDEQLLELREALKKSLLNHRRSWSLPLALLDPKLQVYRQTNVRSGVSDYLCADEVAEQTDPKDWHRGEMITLDDRALTLTAERALDYGLVRERGVVGDFAGLKALYGLQNDPTLMEPSWVDSMVRILCLPSVSALLLIIGLAGLYVELHAPGTGVGGFLAAVAFILFFWASYLDTTASALEIVLFVTGVTFLALEVFVLPSYGIFGLGGGVMVIASLILASQTFIIPTNSSQVRELRNSLLVVGGAGVGFVAVAVLLRRFLPRTPLFQPMMLEPPHGPEAELRRAREAMVDYSHLVGEHGTTLTQLTPSGKARFGQQQVDVITDGQWVPAGSPVVVVAVRGNRVQVEHVV